MIKFNIWKNNFRGNCWTLKNLYLSIHVIMYYVYGIVKEIFIKIFSFLIANSGKSLSRIFIQIIFSKRIWYLPNIQKNNQLLEYAQYWCVLLYTLLHFFVMHECFEGSPTLNSIFWLPLAALVRIAKEWFRISQEFYFIFQKWIGLLCILYK